MQRLFLVFSQLFLVINIMFIFGLRVDAKNINNGLNNFHKITAVAFAVMDADTGQILFAKNGDMLRSPASTTKIMTAWCVLDAIRDGRVSWNDMVTISHHVAHLRISGIRFIEGEKYSLKDIFYAMFLRSANNAASALAEHVAGSEENFVALMMDKVASLGLSHTHFANPNGLSSRSYPNRPNWTFLDQVTTSRELLYISRGIIQDHPEILDISSDTSYVFFPGTRLQSHGENTNEMLKSKQYSFEGMDGLKTGYIDEAGYCFVGTAKRDGRRLITVVLGSHTSRSRFQDTAQIMEYAFNNYITRYVLQRGEFNFKIPVAKGINPKVSADISNDFIVSMNKVDDLTNFRLNVLPMDLTAPISSNQRVGYLQLINNYTNEVVKTEPLIALSDLDEETWFQSVFNLMSKFITKIIDSISAIFA